MRQTRAGGFALPWLILGIAVAMVGFNFIIIRWIESKGEALQTEQTARVLQDAKSRLDNWYRARPIAAEPVNFADAPAYALILREAGIDQLRPQVKISRAPKRFSTNGVAYSRYLLWLAPGNVVDTTAWDITNGNWLIPDGVVSTEFTGLLAQNELHLLSHKTLQSFSKSLENWFEWQRRADPSGEFGRNYFRARDCNDVKPNEFDCVNAFADVTTGIGQKMGIAVAGLTDAWSRPIQFENAPPEVGVDLPPYSVRVRFVPPGSADSLNSVNLNLTTPAVVTVLQRL